MEDSHLLNVQRVLRERLRDLEPFVECMADMAERYNDYYADKDWAPHESAPDEDELRGETKIALMCVSHEVRRRGLEPKQLREVEKTGARLE